MYDGCSRATGTDHFNLLDELHVDEVRACCAAQTFVDDEALPLLVGMAADDPLPDALLTRLRSLVLDEIVLTSPVARGLVVLELCRGDVRLWDAVAPALPEAPDTRAWVALGQATGAADVAAAYWAGEAGGLDRLAEEVAVMQLVCLRLGRLLGQGAASARTVELAVRHSVRTSAGIVELARRLLDVSAAQPTPVAAGVSL